LETATLKRQKLNCVWPASEPETLQSTAEEIWQIAYSEPISLADLCARCNVCALRVYQAVAGMLRAGLFALTTTEKGDRSQAAPPNSDATVPIAQYVAPTAGAQPESPSSISLLAG
jgi:hypothetical protein